MIEFREIEGKLNVKTFGEIEKFYSSIFGKINREKFNQRMSDSKRLLTILALYQNEIVGFKIGYETVQKTFYSWIGGVDVRFRKHGIAAELMKRQHDWCARSGYEIIRTKTKNSFKAMLILNLKSGFDIIEVYSDINNEIKIILEKNLTKL